MGKPGRHRQAPGAHGVPTAQLPRKKMYRARAHSNPLSDQQFTVPDSPDAIDWSTHFPGHPSHEQQRQQEDPPTPAASVSDQAVTESLSAKSSHLVRFADIGCGFGGLLINLAPLYPETLMVGMELRSKVSEYVRERIACLRVEHPGQYTNCTCVRTNAMKYLPHYFRKGQLTKMFFLFPDPHFKVANHRRRIINTTLLTEYAYLLAPGGWLYTITDVKELGDWMRSKLASHPMFEPVDEEELTQDPAAQLLTQSSEEGQKVARNGGATYRAVFRRLQQPRDIPANPEQLASRR